MTPPSVSREVRLRAALQALREARAALIRERDDEYNSVHRCFLEIRYALWCLERDLE